MKLKQDTLREAADQGLLSVQQAEALWEYLHKHDQGRPSFVPTHVLYYFGGMIAIGAMSVFMTMGWEHFGGAWLAVIALIYAGIGVRLTEVFLKRQGLRIPASIMAALVVVLVPLATYGVQDALGLWGMRGSYRDYHRIIDGRWLVMEIMTLAAAGVLLWRYRLPFLVLPLSFTLWYMSMDLVEWVVRNHDLEWAWRPRFSMVFGLGVVVMAMVVDFRDRRQQDFAFWLYIFGVITFWSSLSLMGSGSQWGKFIYCCVNVLMIGVGVVIGRRIFAIFGGLGVAGYLGHLSYTVFRDSLIFPFALSLIGLGIVGMGILWQRYESEIHAKIMMLMPPFVQSFLDRRQ